MIPSPDTERAYFITPVLELASTALILAAFGGLAWYLAGFQVSVITTLIAGFAVAAAEISYSRNALAVQQIAITNLLIHLAKRPSIDGGAAQPVAPKSRGVGAN